MTIKYLDSKRISGLEYTAGSAISLDHDFTESGSTSHTGNGTVNSVEGWTTNDYIYSKIDGTNDRLDFRSKGDGTNDSITYDLGSALSDSAWLIRFELTLTTLSHSGLAPGVDRNECNFGMFSSDYSSGFTASQDSLGFQLHIDRDGTYRYYVHNTDGSGLTGYTSGQRNDNFTTTTYYVQMKRTSSTAFEVKFYTNNTYTTEISGDFSSSVTVPSTVTGLRYFGFKNSDNYNYGGDGAGYIDNVKIYDGISSNPVIESGDAKPTNVQDNSIFVETDTARRYWFNCTTWTMEPTFEDVLSSSTGWTVTSPHSISGGVLSFTSTGGIATYDLGTTLSDTQWVMRYKHTPTTLTNPSGNWAQAGFGLSDNTSAFTSAQDFLGINQFLSDTTSNARVFRISIPNGGTLDSTLGTSLSSTMTLNTPWYVEVTRLSATQLKVELFSDSNYSTSIESVTNTISSGITGLQYIKSAYRGVAGNFSAEIEDIKIYNGVTTIN